MKILRKFLLIIIPAFIVGLFAISPTFSASSNFGEIDELGWATEYNQELLADGLQQDIKKLQPDPNSTSIHIPLEVRASMAFMNALSHVGAILDRSLVRFMITIIIVAYIFWLVFETYNMMKAGQGLKDFPKKVIERGVIISIWLIILSAGPARVFSWIMNPIIDLGTYMSNLILSTVTDYTGFQLPDICDAIHDFAKTNSAEHMLLDSDTAANLMCIPAQISGFLRTGISAGFAWLSAGIMQSAFTSFMGLAVIVLFIYLSFKFAFMALGVVVDLFLSILLLPFTAFAESIAKTSYSGIAGTIFNGFLEIFHPESLSNQTSRVIKALIYFVSLSMVVSVSVALLSGVITTNLSSTAPTLDNIAPGFTTVLAALLVAYMLSTADKIATKIGGSIDSEVGKMFNSTAKTLWQDSYGKAVPWVKQYLKDRKKK